MVPSRLPALPYRKIAKLLQDEGFTVVGQNGSHVYFHHRDGRRTTVPRHGSRPIGKGLLLKILKDAGIDPERLR